MTHEEDIESLLKQPSLYPDLPRKSEDRRKDDLVQWLEKYGEVNRSYNLYGLDVVDFRNPDDFLDNGVFKSQRYKANSSFYPNGSQFAYDYSIVFRDKRLFDAYFARLLPPKEMPTTYAYLVNGQLLGCECDGAPMSIEEFAQRHDGEHLAVKQTFGCHGVNLISCHVEGGRTREGESLRELFEGISPVNGAMWIIQKWLRQHPRLSAFNATSINTLRIVSYHTGTEVVISGASLLVGPEGSLINNPEAGNEMLFGIGLDGTVSESAYSFALGTRVPTSHAGETIPYFAEACALVKRAHALIPEVFSVGWDVVVTLDGPLLLEGNDGWSPRALQFPNQRGERPMWEELLSAREAAFGVSLRSAE